MESLNNSKKRRRKFLERPRSTCNLPEAWAYKGFKIGGECGLFSSQTGNFDIQKIHINDKGNFVVSSGEQNNGIIGKTDVDAKIIKENTITVDMFGNVFFRDHKYKMVTHARVFSLEYNNGEISREVGMYFVALMKYFRKKFSYSDMASYEKIKNIEISLPITPNGDIDFDFMEKYIRELEAEKIRELEAYLEAQGLNDTILSEDENAVINKITNGLVKYKEFRIGGEKGLFSSQTGNFDIQKIHINDIGNFVVSSGEQNNGIIGKTDVDAKIIKENTITVDMFGNVFFRDHKYKMVTHARVFSLEYNNGEISREVGMYFVALMKYFRKKFSYSDMASYEKIKNIEISLPITPNGNIDFDFMEKYIRAIEKKAIKGVVDWKDKVIAKTKEVVAFSDKDNRCISL